MRAALLAALLLACTPKSEAPSGTGGTKAPATGTKAAPAALEKTDPMVKLLQDIQLLTRGRSLSKAKAKRTAAAIAKGRKTVDEFIDEQLKHKDLGKRIAKGVILGGSQGTKKRHPYPGHSILKSKGEGKEQVYYLRGACSPESALEVTPWWDAEGKVKICPKDYKPEVFVDEKGRTCGASMLSPYTSKTCGCGPRLMYCARDEGHYNAMRGSAQSETNLTVALVVNKDRPIDDLYTMNETVRGRNAELLYRRARVAAGEPETLLDLSDIKKAELRPRHAQVPGHHAGILTSPSLIYGSDALRGVLRNYYDYMWCVGQASSRVTTAAVLGLGKVDLRVGDGWKALANMDICTDCHARLDYGMQFFKGYPSSANGVDFRPKQSLKGPGKLYGDHIKDERGEGELNPQGFAKLALSQDEFAQCMTKKVVHHVFAGRDRGEDFDAVLATFEKTRRFKPTLRTALKRFAAARGAPKPVPSAGLAAAKGEVITLPGIIRKHLDNYCMECHDEGEILELEFHSDQQPRAMVEKMLEQVGFGAMPKGASGLDDELRLAFVNDLVDLLWADAEARKAAKAYFGNGMRAHPVHRIGASFGSVASSAGAKKRKTYRTVEGAQAQGLVRYSPGFAAATGLSALEVCKKERPDEVLACVIEASAPERLMVGPAH